MIDDLREYTIDIKLQNPIRNMNIQTINQK